MTNPAAETPKLPHGVMIPVEPDRAMPAGPEGDDQPALPPAHEREKDTGAAPPRSAMSGTGRQERK